MRNFTDSAHRFNRIAAVEHSVQQAGAPKRWLFALGSGSAFALVGPQESRFFMVVLHGVGRSKLFTAIRHRVPAQDVAETLRFEGFQKVGSWHAVPYSRGDARLYQFQFGRVAELVDGLARLHLSRLRRELEGR